MTLKDEKPSDTIYQATKHAMLIPWGRLSRHLKLSERLRHCRVTEMPFQEAT